jgi:hypothetical protein
MEPVFSLEPTLIRCILPEVWFGALIAYRREDYLAIYTSLSQQSQNAEKQ